MCHKLVVYQQAAVPHAPCHCMEAGCGFASLPPALAGHLTAI
jgi:hypothetical protein